MHTIPAHEASEVIVPDAARMARWCAALKPVMDQHLDELSKNFLNARAPRERSTTLLEPQTQRHRAARAIPAASLEPPPPGP
jgi:hypothetical protein